MKVKIPPKVTASAFNKIMSIGGKKCLRVAVEGGGCSGFQYEISMDSDIKENDLILSENECRVVIDPISLEFLSGAIIDFKEELIGSKFVIENPNATSSCGCGTSFSI
jgi:iron-sulfur cluster insertion protein